MARAYVVSNKIFNEEAALQFFTGEPKSKHEYAEHFGCHPERASKHINQLGSNLVIKRWEGTLAFYSTRTSDKEIDVPSNGAIDRQKLLARFFNQALDEFRPRYRDEITKAQGEKEIAATNLRFAGLVFDRFDELVDQREERKRSFNKISNQHRDIRKAKESPAGLLLSAWSPFHNR